LTLTCLIILAALLAGQSLSAKPFRINPLLKSALVPGWGQVSLDRNYGYGMIASEVLLWSTLFYHNTEQELKDQESYEFALKFAHINPGSYSSQYYRDLAKYDTSGFEAGGYNALVRENAINLYPDNYALQQAYIDENAIPDEMAWTWDSYQQRKDYSSTRKEILELKDRAQLITGLIIANHVLSSIDMLRLKKDWGTVQPSFSLYKDTPVLNLRVDF
ncbi:MAG: hypothetical protein R6V77_08195, partial [Candidatus Cloacimonadaceae bacterium]